MHLSKMLPISDSPKAKSCSIALICSAQVLWTLVNFKKLAQKTALCGQEKEGAYSVILLQCFFFLLRDRACLSPAVHNFKTRGAFFFFFIISCLCCIFLFFLGMRALALFFFFLRVLSLFPIGTQGVGGILKLKAKSQKRLTSLPRKTPSTKKIKQFRRGKSHKEGITSSHERTIFWGIRIIGELTLPQKKMP